MATIYLTNRLSSLSSSDLELRRRLDYAEIADETIIEKVEKLDEKINIVLERTLTQGTKIRDLENKKPLD